MTTFVAKIRRQLEAKEKLIEELSEEYQKTVERQQELTNQIVEARGAIAQLQELLPEEDEGK